MIRSFKDGDGGGKEIGISIVSPQGRCAANAKIKKHSAERTGTATMIRGNDG